ncbi:YgaP family membrane protein [Actomonas aquatica]|uniref:DUF2892 domain-containing protein n=1 Tax=Actomonas aquatica TaxID=2866162 RepID=A0ABZ1C4G4_9BACT|nr:DUF2892 domain-containing protein [Opitutus sp. WL0086]WRQ86208.1 DUF2892 domain-containing protein [Opitutus sp. WL0086]
MTCNVGSADRIARIILGLAALGAGFYFESLWGLIGLVPLFTAVLRWCPLYVPLKLSTAKKDATES